MAIDKGENCCQVLSQGALLLLQSLRGLINALPWLRFRPLPHQFLYLGEKNLSSTGLFCVTEA